MRTSERALLPAFLLTVGFVACAHNEQAWTASAADARATHTLRADAAASMRAIGAASQMKGTIALDESVGGAKLTVDLSGAQPGRYAIQILDVGTCAQLDDLGGRGTEDTTGGGMSMGIGSQLDQQGQWSLARVDVGPDGYGHAELLVSRAELGARTFADLQQHLVIVREDKMMSPIGAPSWIAPDPGIMACGALEPTDAG